LPCALADAFVDAARAAGLGDEEDYNGCAYEGAWRTEQAHRGGSRFSVYNAYLEPAMGGRTFTSSSGRRRRGSCSTAAARWACASSTDGNSPPPI
jgi:hypothetical protein